MEDRLKELIIIRGFTAIAVLTPSLMAILAYGIIGVGYVWLVVQGVVSIALAPRLVAQASYTSRAKTIDGEDVNHI